MITLASEKLFGRGQEDEVSVMAWRPFKLPRKIAGSNKVETQPLAFADESLWLVLTEVRHDVLYEAVSILLLVRQQLQRINQISTKALRYCMRSEDLGLVNTFACLHRQEPVWFPPVTFFSTDRTPPMLFSLLRPTKRGLPSRNCCNAGASLTSKRLLAPPAGAKMRRK